MNTAATFGVLTTPRIWHELPVETWDAGAPRREKADPPKTDYFGEERRYMGRPVEGLHPLEDVCKRIKRQAERIHDQRARERAEAERQAHTAASLVMRLERTLGLYAWDAACDLLGLTRDELSDRLALASGVMEACA